MDIWTLGLPLPVALAAVAVIGYLIGSRRRRIAQFDDATTRREVKRAETVVRELESVSQAVRRELATHHSSLLQFKDRVTELSGQQESEAWHQLCSEAETMLKPTLRLAGRVAHAYDEIRQQTNMLMTFTDARTDPLTGLSNRRALDEALRMQFALMSRYNKGFSIIIADVDHFQQVNQEWGHLYGDQMLQQIARLLDEQVRETDMVTRYGGEEFVIIMPETDLDGASLFGERICRTVEAKLSVTVSAGVASAVDGDNPRSIISRADSALYGAKSAGRNCVYRHTGNDIEPVAECCDLIDQDEPAGRVESPLAANDVPTPDNEGQMAKAQTPGT